MTGSWTADEDAAFRAAADGSDSPVETASETDPADKTPSPGVSRAASPVFAARGDGGASWPQPLRPEALHGLAGEIVTTIEPETEADPAAVLVSLLVAYGNVIGRSAGWKVGGTFHATNVNVLLVGPTSSGRKGTAGDEALRVFEQVDPEWCRRRVVSGLSSGEGLVWQVRDPITKRRKAKKDEIPNYPDGFVEEIDDPGEADKRLLVIEAEFSQALKVMQREGNTLSPTVRRLWDRGDAQSMVKMSPGKTTGALVSIAGHISAEELRRQLGDAEIANGFVNRFLIVCSRRSKRLPFGGNLSDAKLATFVPRLQAAVEHGRGSRALNMDAGARTAWLRLYGDLDTEWFGMLGAVLRRGVPTVRRLSVIYALLDCAPAVREEHLHAAVALWRFCEESARFVFGDALGSRLADKMRQALNAENGEWLTREQLRKAAGSNSIPAAELDVALRLLLDHGLAESRRDDATGGRPAEKWRSTEPREGSENPPESEARAWEEREEREERGADDLSSLSSHEEAASYNGHEALATPEEEALLAHASRLIGGEL